MSLLTACGGDDGTTDPAPNTAGGATSAAAEPAAPTFKACTALTVAEVGAIIGSPVTAREGGGCLYSEEDPRGVSISVTDGVPANDGGGIDSSQVGSESQIDGKAESVPGTGDSAYIVVGKGKMIPTQSIQGAAGVEVKGQLITVALAEGKSMTADQVAKLLKDTLTLIVSKV